MAKWIRDTGLMAPPEDHWRHVCSECLTYAHGHIEKYPPFRWEFLPERCPYCGAEMENGEELTMSNLTGDPTDRILRGEAILAILRQTTLSMDELEKKCEYGQGTYESGILDAIYAIDDLSKSI